MFKNLNCGSLHHAVPGFEETVRLAKEYGFSGVDPDVGYARKQGVQATKELLDKHNLKLGGFGCCVRWRESDSDKDYADSLENFVRDCKTASELGMTRCMTWVLSGSDTMTYRQ